MFKRHIVIVLYCSSTKQEISQYLPIKAHILSNEVLKSASAESAIRTCRTVQFAFLNLVCKAKGIQAVI